jgi:peroxiredoxin
MFGFMLYLALAGVSRTSRYMPIQLLSAVVGSALVLYQFVPWPAFYALGLGLVGVNGYIFWYSQLGRPATPDLQLGAPLPAFSLKDSQGETVTQQNLLGKPALLMFYRGNWCPLCVAQIREVAEQYQALADRGVQVLLISPQQQSETELLAQRFDVPMRFLVDENAGVAEQLKLIHRDVVPPGLGVADPDSVYPTVIISNGEGNIIWLNLTDNYRVRPEPAQYLAVLDAMPS